MALTTERGKVAHLLRRATFGPSAGDIDAATAAGLSATLDRLLSPESQDDDVEERAPRALYDFSRGGDTVRWWMLRMVATRRQLLEKMTFVWHGHLTSGISKTGGHPELMVQQIDAYRERALGSFRDLVIAAAQSAAMILWLDSNQNRKNKPNENFARELMELFTIGIGNYSEADVRETARAFTGWFQRNGEFVFDRAQHDTGPKTVLGYTGAWNGDEIVDILLRQPAAGRFIARKLWSAFAYPNPEDEVVDAIAAVFNESSYSIRAVMRAIFTHPAFYSERAYRAVVKSPVEFVTGFVRALGVTTDGNVVNAYLGAMGQIPLNPPNVAGWPGGATWISTSALIARYNFVNQALRGGPDQPTHVNVAGLLNGHGLTTPDAILDFFVDVMVDGDLPDDKRRALAGYLIARDDGTPGPFTLDERTIDKKVRGLIYLLATTPEYQLN